MGSCHVTQSEKKKEHSKFFLAKPPEKPSATSQYSSKCTPAFIYGFIVKSEFIISKKTSKSSVTNGIEISCLM